jgi:hypothetical protein
VIWRIVAVGTALLAVLGAGLAYNHALTEAATARADAEHQRERAASWKAAHDSLIDERELWDELLTDNERTLERVDERRRRAEGSYQQALRELAEARRWAAAAVPGAVADGLCLHPGSCARGNAQSNPGAPAGAGSGAAAGAGSGWRLTNDALRRGVEDCRAALGKANGKIDAIRKWSEAKKVKQ